MFYKSIPKYYLQFDNVIHTGKYLHNYDDVDECNFLPIIYIDNISIII